jgi:hypothetical protein
MNYENALKVLEEGTAILRKCGIRNWLSAGTALGAYRDGFSKKFVERDTDIDVGVCIGLEDDGDKIYKLLHEEFIKNGFKLIRTYKGNWKYSQLCMEKDGIWFDMYFFYQEGDTFCAYTEYGIMKKPASMVYEQQSVIIDGKQYSIPNDIEGYLALRYGPEWRKPSAAKVSWEQECANLHNRGQVNISNMRCGI